MDYDYRYVLLDEDVEIESKTFKYASENNVTIIVSAPTCLEGMLLNVLGERSPTDNARCKRALERSLSGPRTESCSYGCLDKNILSESGHETIDRLISLLEGNH